MKLDTVRAPRDDGEWQLRAYDLRKESQSLLSLKSIEIYFWHQDDAQDFVQALNAVADLKDLQIDGQAIGQPQASTSTLVGRLEHVAITSASTPTALPGLIAAPYDPAAPVAPEPLAYREKTPPPSDGAVGLSATIGGQLSSTESPTTYQTSPPHLSQPYQEQAAYFQIPPPPTQQGVSRQSIQQPEPPMTPQHQRTGLLTPPMTGTMQREQIDPVTPANQQTLSFAPPPTAQSSTPSQLRGLFVPLPANGTPSSTLPLRDSSPEQGLVRSTSLSQSLMPPPPSFAASTQPMLGSPFQYQQQAQLYNDFAQLQATASSSQTYSPGFSPYSHSHYDTPTSAAFPNASVIHAQAYQPTEAELNSHLQKAEQGGLLGMIDSRSARIEKGVGKWLKRLDKRL